MQPRCPGDAYFRPFSSGIACRFISLLTAAGSVKVPSQTSDVIADGMTRDKSRNMVQNHECLPRRRRNAGQVQPAPWDGSTETLDSSFRWLPQFLQTKRMVSILPLAWARTRESRPPCNHASVARSHTPRAPMLSSRKRERLPYTQIYVSHRVRSTADGLVHTEEHGQA